MTAKESIQVEWLDERQFYLPKDLCWRTSLGEEVMSYLSGINTCVNTETHNLGDMFQVNILPDHISDISEKMMETLAPYLDLSNSMKTPNPFIGVCHQL
jgi:hypothetical protein